MKRYCGIIGILNGNRTWRSVVQILEPTLVDGVDDVAAFQPKLTEEYDLPHHVHHSPDGHSWGYRGSGCAELAKDILWDHLGNEPPPRLYQAFKEDYVAGWPIDSSWTLDAQEVDFWVSKYKDRCERCPHSWGEHIIVRSYSSANEGTIRCADPDCGCEGSWSTSDTDLG